MTSYLDEGYASDEFEEQHDSHGGSVDSSIVLHHGIVLHTEAHSRAVPLGYCDVLEKQAQKKRRRVRRRDIMKAGELKWYMEG